MACSFNNEQWPNSCSKLLFEVCVKTLESTKYSENGPRHREYLLSGLASIFHQKRTQFYLCSINEESKIISVLVSSQEIQIQSLWIDFFDAIIRKRVYIFCCIYITCTRTRYYLCHASIAGSLEWVYLALEERADSSIGNYFRWNTRHFCLMLHQQCFSIKGKYVDGDDINTGKSVLGINNQPFCLNDDVHERLLCYVHIHNLEIPQDPESDLELFVPLLGYLEQDGFQI